ncbi:MAG: hypothetical protein WB661_02910 [Candidatus Bathyarchaeia archaeon]
MRRRGELSRLTLAVIAVAFLTKILLTVFVVPVGPKSDFAHWVGGTAYTFSLLREGSLPAISRTGVYTGMFLLLAPFYALWAALPIAHPPLSQAIGSSSETGFLLVFLMKLPVILSDLIAGGLIASIVAFFSSREAALKSFFLWYLNPYAFYLMVVSGTFDIVPTVIVLAAVVFAMKGRWASAGVTLSVASVARLYPVLLFPVFLFYAWRARRRFSVARMALSFAALILVGLLLESVAIGSLNSVINSIIHLPVAEPWLSDFITFEVGPYISLTPIAVVAQIYLVTAYWKRGAQMAGIPNAVLATLMALLLTSYHHSYHFTWVIPLLTAYFALAEQSPTLFIIILASAYFDSLGYSTTNSTITLFQPLFAGIFYGTKAAYLLKINLQGLGIPSKSRTFGSTSPLSKLLQNETVIGARRD